MQKRVVITGMGIVSPLGVGVKHNWKRLLSCDSGIVNITDMDLKDIPVTIAGRVPWGENEGEFDINKVLPLKDQKKNDKFIVYGMGAGIEAIEDSGFIPETQEDHERFGVLMGSGIGGLQTIYDSSLAFNEMGMRCVSPFFIPSVLINLISGNLSIRFGLKGPNEACVSACSTGAHAIGEAFQITNDEILTWNQIYKTIADALNVSVHTVISHRKNITHKTGIKSVAGLTVFAMLNNLIDESTLL